MSVEHELEQGTMAYTPGLGRTPRIVAIRLGTAALAAAGTLALARWWPFGSAPGENTVLTLVAAAIGVIALGLTIPKVTEGWPVRVTPAPDAVVIPARRLTIAQPLAVTMFLAGLAGVFGSAGGVEGPRGTSPVGWALVAALCAFGLTYLMVQRPWRRRIELRSDALVLGAGEEASHIPWDDIAAIRQAPLVSTATSGPEHMRAYNAAAITVDRHSDTRRPRTRRLEDHYPTGDLACPFSTLLPALQHRAAHPAARTLLANPDQARRLFTGDLAPTEEKH